jgi:hypothetical protein
LTTMLFLQLCRLVNVINSRYLPGQLLKACRTEFVSLSVWTRDLPPKTQVKQGLGLWLHADDDLAIHPARIEMSDLIHIQYVGTVRHYESNEDIQVPLGKYLSPLTSEILPDLLT